MRINQTIKKNTNKSTIPKPKRAYRLHIYTDDEEPFNDILCAVTKGCSEMKPGKKYTLKQIVEFGDPELWGTLSNYTKRCMGASFATESFTDEIYTVTMVDPNKSPIKYLIE